MERRGFIHDILDVKILILYVMSLVEEPISAQTIYELCYQDDCLSYFDVQEAIPQMVRSGHLVEEEFDRVPSQGMRRTSHEYLRVIQGGTQTLPRMTVEA